MNRQHQSTASVFFGALLISAALSVGVVADTISYEVTGVVTGRLGAVDFTAEPITFTTIADTGNVSSINAGPVVVWENIGATTVTISGIGTARLVGDNFGAYAEDLSLVYTPGVAAGGIADLTQLHGIFSVYNSAFVTYETGSPLSKVSGVSTTFDTSGTYQTSLGDLLISEAIGDATFTAEIVPVPEPLVTGMATGLALLGVGLWRRTRR